MLMVRDFSNKFFEISGMPLTGSGTNAKLKKAGINTDSKQYKAVISSMTSSLRGGVGYTTVQSIKNRMSRLDKDGDYINPNTGLAGLLVTDKNRGTKNKIISIPESSREEMFESTKREFLKENGVHNGDTTKRHDVFINLYRKMPKNDRLAAGHTLDQYERQYHQAFIDAAKAADPNWKIGKPIKYGALDNITRESVESVLEKSGSELVRKTFNASI